MCPQVQLGKYPLHPRWGSTGWEPSRKVVSNKFTKSKFPTYAPRGSDGRFKPKTSSTKTRSDSGKGARPIGVVTHVGGDSDESQQQSPEQQYLYVSGLYNAGVFAWPLCADEGLAQALVGTQGVEIPESWKEFTPEASCGNC